MYLGTCTGFFGRKIDGGLNMAKNCKPPDYYEYPSKLKVYLVCFTYLKNKFDALKSFLCDVINIRIERRIATRSGKGNQL